MHVEFEQRSLAERASGIVVLIDGIISRVM